MQSVTSNGVANALGYLVWENPDSTQGMGQTTIEYDRAIPTGYNKIRIECQNLAGSGGNYKFYTDCLLGYNNYLSLHFIAASGLIYLQNRIIDYIDTSSCRVSICRFYKSDVGFSEVENRIIPTRIWAIK